MNTFKREGFVTLAIVVSITAGVLVGLVAFSSIPTELKYIIIYCIGFAAAKIID